MIDPPINAIQEGIRSFEGSDGANLICEPLAGDASDRRYFRAEYTFGGVEKKLVVMDILDVENICKSEEVTLYHDDTGELPFINIQRFLSACGAPVPKIHYFNRETGVMLLEDLGDGLLLYEAEKSDEKGILSLYKKAIDVLVELQIESEGQRPGSDCMAFGQAFAPELLAWEFEHYSEYGIEALLGVQIEAGDRATLKKEYARIAQMIAALPRVFTHRDYHSRNLIVKDDEIYMIDFQDALYGPTAYDLASLIRDSYIDLGRNMRDELLHYYIDSFNRKSGKEISSEEFTAGFSLAATQRNLKAAGRFVFIDKEKGNPAYLESIPRTLSYVAGDRTSNPELTRIIDILAKYEPRLGAVS